LWRSAEIVVRFSADMLEAILATIALFVVVKLITMAINYWR
jgi:hypothetical protein